MTTTQFVIVIAIQVSGIALVALWTGSRAASRAAEEVAQSLQALDEQALNHIYKRIGHLGQVMGKVETALNTDRKRASAAGFGAMFIGVGLGAIAGYLVTYAVEEPSWIYPGLIVDDGIGTMPDGLRDTWLESLLTVLVVLGATGVACFLAVRSLDRWVDRRYPPPDSAEAAQSAVAGGEVEPAAV